MATAKTVDFANIVLILGNLKGTPDILKLSENSRYEFTPPGGDDGFPANWKGGQSEEQEVTGPFLSLNFGEHLYSPEGWLLGSSAETDICDLQLVENNKTGTQRVTSSSKKRPASPVNEDALRFIRSEHPTLSTARARSGPLVTTTSQASIDPSEGGGTTIPDTLPWGASVGSLTPTPVDAGVSLSSVMDNSIKPDESADNSEAEIKVKESAESDDSVSENIQQSEAINNSKANDDSVG